MARIVILAGILVFLFGCVTIAEAKIMKKNEGLNARQRSIIPIAAFTASGDLEKLQTALSDGLDAGLTVNEIKEILVQMYVYAGFPRSLNAINTFMSVMDERKAKGVKDEMGKEASPLPHDMNRDKYGAKVRARLSGQEVIPPPSGYQLFTPVIDSFLKEHLFADIFARDILDHKDRELATISALAGMTGTAGQLRFHLGAAMNTGLNEAQLLDFISVIKSRVGEKEADGANEVLVKVLNEKQSDVNANQAKAGLRTDVPQEHYVRLAEIEIDPEQLESYKAAARKEIDTSVRIEPGVLAFYAVSEKDNPGHLIVIEMYADEEAYRKHLNTPHFKTYKATTQNMVKSLKLIETIPIILRAKSFEPKE